MTTKEQWQAERDALDQEPIGPVGQYPEPVTHVDILNEEDPPGLVIPGFGAPGGTVIIHGDPKCGKSMLMWSGLSELHQHLRWWGEKTGHEEMPRVHVWAEETPHEIRNKLLMVKIQPSTPYIKITTFQKLPSIFRGQWKTWVETTARIWEGEPERIPDLLFIDTLGRWAMSGKDVSDYGAATAAIDELAELNYIAPNLCIVTTHHSNKARKGNSVTNVLGSQAIGGAGGSIIQVDRVKDNDQQRELKGQTRDGEYHRLLTFHEESGFFVPSGRPSTANGILHLLEEGSLSISAMVAAIPPVVHRERVSRQAVEKALAKLTMEGKIEGHKEGGRICYRLLRQPASPP